MCVCVGEQSVCVCAGHEGDLSEKVRESEIGRASCRERVSSPV